MAEKGREQAVMAKGVLLKGLPFQTTVEEIVAFFKSLVIDRESIHIVRFMNGDATGLAFVRLDDEEEIKRALLMDRNHMGPRYIEVKMSDESELYHLMLHARAGNTRNELYRMSGHGGRYPIYKDLGTKFAYISGVPLGSQYKEIRSFFAGRLIGRGKIWLLREGTSGQFRGDGYVEFADSNECVLGIKNSGKKMGNSVMRVEPCEAEEAEEFSEGNLGRGSGNRDVQYRQSRVGGYGNTSWDSGSRGREREMDNYSSSDRYVSRSHRRTPSPARRRRKVYTETYGNNTLLRDDPYREAGLEGVGSSYDPHPNGSYSSSQYSSSGYGGVSSGGDYGSRHQLDSYVGSAYGGHATVARHSEKKYSTLLQEPSLAQPSSRPALMSLMGGGGSGSSVSSSTAERRVVRIEGLPYNVTVPQILEFFNGYDVGYDQVRIQCRDDGSPSGKAFISFPTERHARLATQQLNKRYIGDRYVELFLV